jgi:hypothetical protein
MAKARRVYIPGTPGIYRWVGGPKRRKKIHFYVIAHPKNLPEWMKHNPTFTFESTIRKPKGQTRKGKLMTEATKAAQWLVTEKGLTQKVAARRVAAAVKQLGWLKYIGYDKKRPNGKPWDVAKIIEKRLRQNR